MIELCFPCQSRIFSANVLRVFKLMAHPSPGNLYRRDIVKSLLLLFTRLYKYIGVHSTMIVTYTVHASVRNCLDYTQIRRKTITLSILSSLILRATRTVHVRGRFRNSKISSLSADIASGSNKLYYAVVYYQFFFFGILSSCRPVVNDKNPKK